MIRNRHLVALPLAVAMLTGCGPSTPAPVVPTYSSTPAPSVSPTPTTTPTAKTTSPRPKAAPKPRPRPTVTKPKPPVRTRPKYTCEPDANAKVVGNEIVNKACGYIGADGLSHSRDRWIEDQLRDSRGQPPLP